MDSDTCRHFTMRMARGYCQQNKELCSMVNVHASVQCIMHKLEKRQYESTTIVVLISGRAWGHGGIYPSVVTSCDVIDRRPELLKAGNA